MKTSRTENPVYFERCTRATICQWLFDLARSIDRWHSQKTILLKQKNPVHFHNVDHVSSRKRETTRSWLFYLGDIHMCLPQKTLFILASSPHAATDKAQNINIPQKKKKLKVSQQQRVSCCTRNCVSSTPSPSGRLLQWVLSQIL